MSTELFRDIEGFEGRYEVSNCGRVRNARTGRLLALTPGPSSYIRVDLGTSEGIWKKHLVHRLVAEAFIPKSAPKNTQVNHKNGIKTDNRVENLEWCSPSENVKHAYHFGLKTSIHGEDHIGSKLTEENVKEIRSLRGIIGRRELGKRFGVSGSYISKIQSGKAWPHTSI